MTRMIFAAVFALTPLVFGLVPAAAYAAPWSRCWGWAKVCIGIANMRRSKRVGRMCWQAIADGAIPTRTLSHRMRQRKAGTTTNVALICNSDS